MSRLSDVEEAAAPAPMAAGFDPGVGLTFGRVLRSEWLKLRTLRSSWVTLAAAVAGLVGISALVCWAADNRWQHMRPIERLTFDPLFHSLVGVNLAQLAIGVLGVLFVTGEYGTGMIRATLGAVPRRLPVLLAKLAVFVTVTTVIAIPACFAAFFVGQALLGAHGTHIGAHDVLRCVIGAGLYLAVVGAFAVGIGFIARNTAGGIAILFGLLLVITGIAHALPSSWQQYIVPYLPSEAGGSVFSLTHDPGNLAAWTGFGVFCAWAVAAVIYGASTLMRRDA
jgi:ABC-2 type transport system permease protein